MDLKLESHFALIAAHINCNSLYISAQNINFIPTGLSLQIQNNYFPKNTEILSKIYIHDHVSSMTSKHHITTRSPQKASPPDHHKKHHHIHHFT
jgi:hypothetical protein